MTFQDNVKTSYLIVNDFNFFIYNNVCIIRKITVRFCYFNIKTKLSLDLKSWLQRFDMHCIENVSF